MLAKIFVLAAWLLVLATTIQFYLAGLGNFEAKHSFEAHEWFGNYVMTVLTIVLVVLAFIGRQPRTVIAMTALTLVLVLVQGGWIEATEEAWVKSIHVLGALGIFALSLTVAWQATHQVFVRADTQRR